MTTKQKAIDDETFATALAAEPEAETPASGKCLERIAEKLFSWKPHPKSMEMGYLSLLVAEIPTLDNPYHKKLRY